MKKIWYIIRLIIAILLFICFMIVKDISLLILGCTIVLQLTIESGFEQLKTE